MIITIMAILLLLSFCTHIYFLMKYITTRKNWVLKQFINTTMSNILIAGSLMIAVIFRPELVQQVDVQLLFWLIAGVIMLLMLMVKISVLRTIYRRAQDPAHYHLNFFGKKVLHSTVVRPAEILVFMMTIPFFLFSGAYFVARLINLFLYNHL
jgi:hypothetical protein